MEPQAGAECHGPGQAIGGNLMPGQHLMLWAKICTQAEQGIIDHEAVIADDDGGAPDRVHAGQVALRNEAQRARGRLARGKARRGKRGGRGGKQWAACNHG